MALGKNFEFSTSWRDFMSCVEVNFFNLGSSLSGIKLQGDKLKLDVRIS